MSRFFVVTMMVFAMAMMVLLQSVKPDNRYSLLISAVFSLFLIANILQKDFRVPLMEKIGGFSYTLYATHFQTIILYFLILDIMNATDVTHITNPFLWITAVPIAVVLAYAFYWISERPVKNYLNSLRRS